MLDEMRQTRTTSTEQRARAATAAVAGIILRDSASLQERDAEFLNRHKATKHHPALPLYDSEDAERALDLFTAKPFGREFDSAVHSAACCKASECSRLLAVRLAPRRLSSGMT